MRQRNIWIIVLLLSVTGASVVFGASEDMTAQFSKANDLYDQGKFAEALDAYRGIERNIVNWKVYFNIGNCYFKLEQPIQAKIYYLRAQRLRPFDPAIEKNLQVVDTLFKDVIPPQKPDFIAGVLLRLESMIPLDLVSWLLLSIVTGLNIFILLWIWRGRNKIVLYGVSFFLVFTIILAVYHVARVNGHQTHDTAVVISQESELRSGPGEQNTVLFKVYAGLKVRVIEQNKDWYQVTASSQIAGWIKKDLVTII